MAHAQQTVTVERPIEDVFAFLADGMNEPRWRPDVRDVRLAAGDGASVGSVWAQTMSGPGGRPIQGDYRITRSERPGRLDFEVVAGPARPTGSFTLTATSPSTTQVTFTLDLVPTGLMRLLSGMIAKQVTKEADAIRNLPGAMAG
ncbi:SRPBCC family protein [Amnibacterium sp. CER49]|uniref:SRPBCC family protein n=1 Tax=Amnibacterium sp. CER49 TaxID=3039161 RepID=UPI0024475B55|nr:SRPBCC family protein [Amnibacterium sp. CER49]MDH2443507.1 SRPBCC family protein [Amnibacterium sp. CER49]